MSDIIEIASTTKFSYQKLKDEAFFDDCEERQRLFVRSRLKSLLKFKRVRIKKRFRVKVPTLRRFLRRKVKLVSAVRVSCAKVIKRLKDGRGYFGDLFAGNYLFMQVNPTPLKYFEKSFYNSLPPDSGYSLPRITQY